MTFKIEVDEKGVRVVARRLGKVADAVEDLRRPFDEFLDHFAQSNLDAFNNRGGESGRWPPLKPGSRWGANQPLVRTGRMKKSLTQRPLGVERINRKSFVAGTDVHYYRFHHTGTRWMPARPVMHLSKQDREILKVIIIDHIRTEARSVGPPHRSS